MAKKTRIAGITIELNGDSTELVDSLKKVDKQLNATQDNLRDINKLLKLDPSNTELLTQKQKNLEDAIKGTKERLDTLKNAQMDDMPVEQQEALKREIIETEQKLQGLEKEYKDFGSVGKQQLKAVQAQMKEVGKKVTDFGKAWSTHVTAPIVAVGGLAYKAFTEVDEGLDTIIKKTGASGEALDEMETIMKNLATSIPTDFKTAGEAVGEVNTRFGLTGDALEELSGKFIKFAALNETDVSSAIDSVQAAMAAFNVDTSRAGQVLDIMNKAAQDTGIPVDRLSASLLTNGAALKEMGFSINEASMFLAGLEKSGVDSSTVMAGLKKALANATKEGKPMSEAMAEVQASIAGAKDSTEAAQIATELFGSKAGPAIAQAVQEGKLSFEDLALSMDEYGGNIESTFEATLDPADRFNTAMNTLKALGAEIAETVMPMLNTALEAVRDVVQQLREKWDGLNDEQKAVVLKIVGIVAAIGPLTVALGSVITFLSGPGGIVAAIGLVVAAGVWLVQHWEEVKAAAEAVWKKITDWFADMGKKAEQLWTDIKKFFTDGWEKIKNIDWAKLGSDIWAAIKRPFVTIGTWFKEKFDLAKKWIENILWDQVGTWIWDKITAGFQLFGSIASWFKDKFDLAKDWIKGIRWGEIATTIWTTITSGLAGIGKWLTDVFKAPINAIIDGINWMIGSVEDAINWVIDGINNKLKIDIDFGKLPDFLGGGSLGGIHWSPNLKNVSWGRIDKLLAQGGTLAEGQRAIVGEYAPEYLTVRNGQAVVTPIQGAQRWGQGDTINNTFQIYQQPGENANALAERVMRIMTRQQEQRNNAYA